MKKITSLIKTGVFGTRFFSGKYSFNSTGIITNRLAVFNNKLGVSLPEEEFICTEKLFQIKNRFIPARIYQPLKISPPYPTIIFVHGTGYVSPEYVFSDMNSRHFASIAQAQVINIHHRVAPESLYPDQFKDVYGVYKTIANYPSKFNVDPNNIIFCGYSSGGTIMAQLAIRAKLEKLLQPKKQVLIGPLVDFSNTLRKDGLFAKYKEWADNDQKVSAEFLAWITSICTPEPMVNRKSPFISPYWYSLEELSGIAPTDIITGTQDRSGLNCYAFADKLSTAGVTTTLHVGLEENHTAIWRKPHYIEYVSDILSHAVKSNRNELSGNTNKLKIQHFSAPVITKEGVLSLKKTPK